MSENTQNDNMKGALAYLLGFITGIVLLLVEKDSKFVRFHAMQSTIVFGALALIGFIPFFGLLLWVVLPFVYFVLWIFLMWKAYNGEMYKLPFVGDLAEKQLAKMGK